MEETRLINKKLLRCGYTTGTCAAAASKAAVKMLLSEKTVDSISIKTPAGISLTLDVLEAQIDEKYAKCAIRRC